jgi:uncharacterized protein DUF4062
MDTRYQVFISSTFKDLKDERQAVLKAVLELDHMPAGMELFPASDDSAWQLIKDIIEGSDFYVLIIGGRYGSQDESGIGYTEKEYDYAINIKKPVIPLLHENPDNLPRDRTDINEDAWKKLQEFRDKVEKRHTCVYWRTPEDLKAKVIVGLTATMKRHPGIGWIRADQVPSEATYAEMLSLREKIAALEAEAANASVTPPKGTEDLRQGEDEFEINFTFGARPMGTSTFERVKYSAKINPSWNDLFAAVAPSLINEGSDLYLKNTFRVFLTQLAKDGFSKHKDLKGKLLDDFGFRSDEIETCIVQFRALGYIQENLRQRSVKDTNTYWALTKYGDYLMTQLRAIRRNYSEKEIVVAEDIRTEKE